MNSDAIARMDAFLAEEYHRSEAARRAGNIGSAWHHLERAHIVAQVRLGPHCGSHLRMLRLAWRLQNWREIRGQIFRLVLAPLGNVTGRLPIGNNGRSNVSAFARMEIEPEIKRVLGLSASRSDRSSKNTVA
ncbi:DUF3703 domain-containing protein [Altererythrobacter sp. C41]|uniref:DUF3703 domain-containing protein n=1 Tax=Altererythrobacter sp. C41 TaxID=2806021 RepID=UPI0019337DCD|nr:DUF3703 domain-containing protein [Altererythrobacter sp. C41]MBM0169523.1 DUF3703 domain-containing protein [Altererythrobacter sp. C41]